VIARKFSCGAPRRVSSVPWAILVGLVAGAGCTGGQPDPDAEQLATLRTERAELRSRFSAVQDGIRRTQAAALDDPGVRAAQESFYERLAASIMESDPAAAGLLERARRIGADLDRVSGPVLTTPEQADEAVASASEREAVANELAAVELALRPHIDRAMQDPEVNTAFTALQDSVQVVMERIDPSSAAAVARLKQIAEQMRDLDGQIARLEGDR
jgi:hypothetical protein